MSDTSIITPDEMTGLLGRPLSSTETAQYSIYLEIAQLRLEDLLCIKFADISPIPADLKLLLARCFAVISQEQTDVANHGVNRKQVEDFSISYFENADSPMVVFARQNSSIIDKYGQCQAKIRSGRTACGDCFQCI